MRRLRVAIVDLVTKGPTRSLWARVMHANLASVMPQAVAVWCEAEGHEVTFVCYTGLEDIHDELPGNVDLVFIGAFTESALLAYALSNHFRAQGAVTALGGPHARCYPEDARKYFDYVLGFTDRTVIHEVLSDCSAHRPEGALLAAQQQPRELPGVRQRWKFIATTLRKAPVLKIVPMLGSLGCPYTCSFCIDSVVPYQPFDVDGLKEDLRFLLQKMRRPGVAWYDPNFGVRFDAVMDAIEEAAPRGGIDFIAESSLSLLGEDHLRRLGKNGFQALLPGIESWYELGNKSKTGRSVGLDKVQQVSDHVNLILRHVPYVQTNFVLGLDCDEGEEPFELTKEFLRRTPGAFPGFSLLSAFGRAAPINLELQRAGRVLPFPFPFLDNNHAMNVRPKNYSWPDFYDQVIDLTRFAFSWKSIGRRFQGTRGVHPRWMNVVRAISSEGFGRIQYYTEVRRRLDSDLPLRRFFEQTSSELPEFYVAQARKDLGALWSWLPPGAMRHDPNAYSASERTPTPAPSIALRRATPGPAIPT